MIASTTAKQSSEIVVINTDITFQRRDRSTHSDCSAEGTMGICGVADVFGCGE